MLSLLLALCLLQTKSTTLALADRAENGTWEVLHYGPRLESGADVSSLGWVYWLSGGTNVNQPYAHAYTAFGQPGRGTGNPGSFKFGGLQVTHADGSITTTLTAGPEETVPDAEGVQHIKLTYKDAVYPFVAVQHFRAFAACDVIETWVELTNNEKGAVQLSRMDSFAVYLPKRADEFQFQSMSGQWACESQLTESSIARGQTVMIGSRSGVRDAWEANASFMLTFGPKATETQGQVLGGVLCWSGMWEASVRREVTDAVEIRAGAVNPAGPYTLKPGQTITLPKFAFTYSAAGKGQVSRNIHKWARDWHLPKGHKLRPILLNNWEGTHFDFTEEKLAQMMDEVKDMGGELFVLDDGWFGSGKFARNEKNRDTAGLGDWTVNPEKLPHGLTNLLATAKAKGLDFGFWLEPEMADTNSWLYTAHPEWAIGEKNRPVIVGRGRSQVVLDYANPTVRDNIYGQMDALFSQMPGLAYVKWDANADMMGLGSSFLASDSQGNLPFDYTVGLYEMLAKIRQNYPDLDIQACSAGGGRVDYGFLAYADEFWCSDDSDARQRVFIQWGDSQFYPACTMGSHVTGVPNNQTGRITPLKFRFDVAMSGRFGFELLPEKLTAEELSFAKKCVTNYKRIRPTVQQGDLYRLVSPYGHSYASLMYVNEAKTHAVVFLWGLERAASNPALAPLYLQGLDPDKHYMVKEINRLKDGKLHTLSGIDGHAFSGASLQAMGLPVGLAYRPADYDSAVFELTAE